VQNVLDNQHKTKIFPNRNRRLSFLKTNSCISFLISSSSKMALCTWHNATLFRRIWPQVDRVNDFNLRIDIVHCWNMKLSSSLIHNIRPIVGYRPMTYLLMRQADSKFQCNSYLHARTPQVKKLYPHFSKCEGCQKMFSLVKLRMFWAAYVNLTKMTSHSSLQQFAPTIIQLALPSNYMHTIPIFLCAPALHENCCSAVTWKLCCLPLTNVQGFQNGRFVNLHNLLKFETQKFTKKNKKYKITKITKK